MKVTKRKKSLKEKGITLIALVVTIVILLILAAVTINMTLGSNGLFIRAQAAREQYENSTANEVEQMNDVAGILEELEKQNGGETTIPSSEEGTTDRTGISVGDYIDYKPDPASVYPVSKLSSSITGFNNTNDISQDTDMKWQILKVYNDGSMDIIGTPTSSEIGLGEILGYNNGVYVLNDICKVLYSKNSKGITARSVNLQDYENWLTPAGKAERDAYTFKYVDPGAYDVKYGETIQYTGSNSYTPDIFEKTDNESDSYYDRPTDKTYSGGGRTDTLDVKQTYYQIPINETNYGEGNKVLNTGGTSVYLASRFAICSTNCAYFGLRRSGGYDFGQPNIYGYDMFDSDGFMNLDCTRIRPVVSLKSSVKIELNKMVLGEFDAQHHITKY